MSDAQAPVTDGVAQVVQDKAEEAPGFKVFAGNLSYDTTDEGLKAFFAPVASDILTAQVIMRGTRSAGYGFVAVSSAEAAQKAVDVLHKQELDGREVIVEVAKPSDQKEKKEKKSKRRPGRRGSKAVPGEVTEAEANGETPKAEGDADAAKPKKKKKKSTRKGKKPAEGEVEGEAAPAPATDGEKSAEGAAKKPRAKKPKTPRTPRPAGEDPAGEPSKSVLFVANLGFSVDDAGLASLFTEAGVDVVSARIVRRRWGTPRRSKGYGFVDVGNEDEQKKAIASLDGKEFDGRTIAVKIAVNTPHEDEEKEASAGDGAAPAEPPAAAAAV